MPRPQTKRPSPLLRLSLLLNLLGIGLLVALIWQIQTLYGDYRYHRTLVQGSSEASDASIVASDDVRTVVLLGDSRISEWRPAPQIAGYRIINAGVGGESTIEIQRRLQRDVLRLQPDIVVIQAGINDLTAAATRGMWANDFRAQLLANLDAIVTTLTDSGIRVVLSPIIPAQRLNLPRQIFWSGDLHTSVTNANHRLRGLARDRGTSWFDINQPVTNAQRKAIPSLYSDTLHLNQTAYRKLNEALAAHLNAMALL